MKYCIKYLMELSGHDIRNHNCYNNQGIRKKGLQRNKRCRLLMVY